jgi:hypothetical protein
MDRPPLATLITAELKAFIEDQTSVFLAIANSAGQPSMQHRADPAGCLRVIDARTLELGAVVTRARPHSALVHDADESVLTRGDAP